MDIISQLQEQVNFIAGITFNTIGTLQRDAPPVRLSPNYPEVQASSTEDPNPMAEQPKSMTTALIQASKQFEALVDALPLSEEGEELQLKRIAELKDFVPLNLVGEEKTRHDVLGCFSPKKEENEAVGEELQKELEAAELELKQIQELFNMTADNYLNLKSPN